ncbi:MAG: bifunctional diaminohydroxyphosphoribosylaminopyrimidine deaminase/5-amino-6-(5-phosphoribosylamino)uracil reductase RibD [Saprospiraceae bacterium]
MEHHQLFIQRCFELAQLAAGSVAPNPRVGAVITYQNKIIGEGFHQFAGGPHAEINAINSLKNKDLLSKSTLYISLEPCNNYGKTLPCVNSILAHKIPVVNISLQDPNPMTMGQSINKLKRAGVKVKINILPKKGVKTTAGFLSTFQKGRPQVILKYAQSLNKMMGVTDKQFWISNPYTKRLTHKWRSEHNAIIIGSGTLAIDNPRLNNRLYFGKSPVKLLLKRDGYIAPNTAILHSEGRTIIVCEPTAQTINYPNTKQWRLAFDEHLLPNILKNLTKEGLNSLIVEGGATLLNSFIQQNLWDEARIFTGNKLINATNSIPAPILRGQLTESFQIGDNRLEIFENSNSQ